MINERQTNKKIIIDAAHGGEDTGTVANGITEKDLTLKISKYIYDRLKALGIPVTLTRDTDITLSPDERNQIIIDTYGDNKDTIIISNQVSSDDENAEIIYALRNNNKLSNLIEQSLDESGLQAKKPYQLRLPSDTSKDYYAIHRLTENTEPIIIEYSSLKDTERANDINNNWQKYTEAVVKALAEYLGVVYDQDSNIYVVQKGDTLWSIARKFNISVSEIKQLNNLSTNSLSINQKLKIPSYETTPSTAYTVQSGDSLYKIANKYNVTVEELKKANNLTSNILSINQVLIIPSSEQTKPLENKDIIYTVKKGDNLYNIAKSYNTTVSAIMSYNNLKTNLLNINQQLKIPTSSQNIYVVQSGDNLYNIAKKYNTTVDKIKQANNLSSNLLSIGQKLII